MEGKKSSITNFYRDRSILITGATGFIGKALLEKLLRSCHGIKTIYLLIRPRKDEEAKHRLEELLKAKLFERVKKEQPDAISKVVAIQGDLASDRLGMYPSDEKLITENVSIVFHSAAITRFDRTLKQTSNSNTLGTRRLVELCRKMQKLEACIHVSTAYLNGSDELEEVVYHFPVSTKRILDSIEWMSEDLLKAVTPHLLRDTPSCYSYSKALTEAFLAEECYDLPIAIVRPTIVSAAWKEPYPGWVDNLNAATGFILTLSKGLLRCYYCKPSSTADLIPIDVVVNLLIATAWHTANQRPKDITVYNCASGYTNKISWERARDCMLSSILRYPSNDMFRYPSLTLTSNRTVKFLINNLSHMIPAYFYDFLSVLTGRRPRLVRLYKRMNEIIDVEGYFLTRDITYITKNTLMLQEMLPPEDRKEFDFSIKSLSWPAYIEGYVLGIRQHLLKEEPSSLQPARKKLKRLFLYETLTKYTCIAVIAVLWLIIFIK